MKLARKNIYRIKPYIPGKPIEEVQRELGLKSAIKLASNENPLGPSPKAVSAAKKALFAVNRYPDGGSYYLKNALSAFLGIKPENIVIGNGSDEIIVLTLRAFLNAGEEVIISRPTFLIYELASEIQSASVRFAPLKNLRYDVNKIVSLISGKTRIIFIANPDNPTGTYLTAGEIEYLVSKTPGKTVLFFDEAYFEFAKDIKDYPKSLKYLNTKNVIITRSFSKVYGLAGLRIGYGMAKKDIIECLDKVREPFNVNSVAQKAAIAALKDTDFVKKTKSLVGKGKSYIYDQFDSLGIDYIPSAANFILFKMGSNSNAVYSKLLARGIIVREMSSWKLNNFIRVTVGTEAENREFIRALKEVIGYKK